MDWDVDGPCICGCCGLALVCAGKPCPECGSADGWAPLSEDEAQDVVQDHTPQRHQLPRLQGRGVVMLALIIAGVAFFVGRFDGFGRGCRRTIEIANGEMEAKDKRIAELEADLAAIESAGVTVQRGVDGQIIRLVMPMPPTGTQDHIPIKTELVPALDSYVHNCGFSCDAPEGTVMDCRECRKAA